MKTLRVILAAALVTAPTLRAQIVNDGATNTLSNVTNTFTGDVTVGTNGSFTLLILSNNALLTNSVRGLIGHNATAKSNEVRLVSPSARWLMGNNLFVGSNGAVSRLVVSNGARVENFDGVLANGTASSNNVALVTGSGSIWSNRGDLTLGFSGRENQLIVSNGGRVANRFGYLGRQPGSSNNFARVTGSGSVWSNQFDLAVGLNDRSNRLVIEAGGVVSCANGVISGSSSSGNNEVLVTGPGSLWSNRFFLFMGDVAGRNRLVVSNGATVWSGGGIFGNLSPAVSNHVIVTGPGSVWTNESSLSLGGSSSGNRVDVSDGGQLASNEGFVGQDASSHSNIVVLAGTGSGWNNLAGLIVGNSGSGNVLIASNGAAVLSSNAIIGANVNFGNNNLALLTGLGTLWSNRTDFVVGSNGSGNRLVVSNAARVYAGANAFIGFNASSSSNTVLLTGAGSTWSNQNTVFVGRMGSGNRFTVSNAASADSSGVFLGVNTSSSNNEVTVTGPGSIWSSPEWGVGSSGKANRLVLTNGGQVRSSFGSVGAFGGGDNLAVVTDSGSSWTNDGEFYVGIGDSRNVLVVSNGGALSAQSLMVGRDSSSLGNRVSVAGGTLLVGNDTGTGVLEVRRGTNLFNAGLMDVDQLVMTNTLGRFAFNGGTLITRGAFINNNVPFIVGDMGTNPAVWDVRAGAGTTVRGEIYVGNSPSFNRLLITNGAQLVSTESVLGFGATSSNNLAVVTGSGSVWSNRSEFHVGRFSAGNQLVVSNGGFVSAESGEIGSEIGSANNQVTVTGAGSKWSNTNLIYVGNYGVGNRLMVADGGAVHNSNGYIGSDASSSSNLAVVSGLGSVWSNAAHLYIGNSGPGNQLVVSNGGFVTTGLDSLIGVNSGAEENKVMLSGLGSRWVVNRFFELGRSGDDNDLLIENGASLVSGKATIGVLSASQGNQASVSGPGTTWTNLSSLEVGAAGSGNALVVSDGACVVSSNGTIGALASASGNGAGMFGPNSRWLMEGDLCVGSNGPSSVLFLNGGGPVVNANGIIGFRSTSSSNTAAVVGAGAVWSNRESLYIGRSGRGNQLAVSSGGMVWTPFTSMGFEASSSNNIALVTDAGSLWTNGGELFIGDSGPGNQVVVSNGGFVRNDYVAIGFNDSSSNNSVLVIDGGSLCSSATALDVGRNGSHNQLVVSNGATVTAGASVILGVLSNSLNNRVVVDGGTLHVSNALGNAVLDIRRGTNVLNAGLIDVNRLLLTNALGFFEFNGGKLWVGNSTVSNGQLFRVGNGVSPATLALAGNGVHSFANGLTVSANATLTGNGTVSGILSVQTNGTLAPGASIGKMVLSNSPSLQGAVVMEISKNGATLTNDQIQVAGALTYGGSLTVTNLGPDALNAGDSFQLFSAPGYSGTFSSISLPALPVGLTWTNKLLVNGSIQVVAVSLPKFTSINVSGTNLIFTGTNGTAGANYTVLTATNVTTPVANWQSLVTNQFGAGGGFSFTNGIASGEPQRYFRIRVP